MIRKANAGDANAILTRDRHIKRAELQALIAQNRVYLAEQDDRLFAWMRYNLFWDNTPFLNMLFVLPDFRAKGIGRALVETWHREMAEEGHKLVLTSTVMSETAHSFFRLLGYAECGILTLPDEPRELLLCRKL